MRIELYGVSYAEANTFFYEENNLPEGLEDEFSIEDGGWVDAEGGDMRSYAIIEYSGDDIAVEQELFSMVEELSDEYIGEIMDYEKGGSVDENKAHYYKSEGTIWVDSNFVNLSKGNIPNSELKHYGYGDFYLDTPKGQISFYRVDKDIDGFVGRSHKFVASDELGSELFDAMEGKYEEIRAYAEGGGVDKSSYTKEGKMGEGYVIEQPYEDDEGEKFYGYLEIYSLIAGEISDATLFYTEREAKAEAEDFSDDAQVVKVKMIDDDSERGYHLKKMKGVHDIDWWKDEDLFEHYERLPNNIQELIFIWGERLEDGAEYEDLKDMLSEFEALGYTFDYGLDAEPYDLREIGQYADGGNVPKGHTKELETEDFIWYVDENGEYVIMIRKSDGSVASDNYFAENDLYERMVEIANGREKYIYLRPESKEYLKEFEGDYAKGGVVTSEKLGSAYKLDGNTLLVTPLRQDGTYDNDDWVEVAFNLLDEDLVNDIKKETKSLYAKGGMTNEEKWDLLYNFLDQRAMEGDENAEDLINTEGYDVTYDQLYNFADEKMMEGDEEAERVLERITEDYAKGGHIMGEYSDELPSGISLSDIRGDSNGVDLTGQEFQLFDTETGETDFLSNEDELLERSGEGGRYEAKMVWYYTFDGEDLRYEEIIYKYARGGEIEERAIRRLKPFATSFSDEDIVLVNNDNWKIIDVFPSITKAKKYGNDWLETQNEKGIKDAEFGVMLYKNWKTQHRIFFPKQYAEGGNIPTITKKEWDKFHSDYKSTIDGTKYVMAYDNKEGTYLTPVVVEG